MVILRSAVLLALAPALSACWPEEPCGETLPVPSGPTLIWSDCHLAEDGKLPSNRVDRHYSAIVDRERGEVILMYERENPEGGSPDQIREVWKIVGGK